LFKSIDENIIAVDEIVRCKQTITEHLTRDVRTPKSPERLEFEKLSPDDKMLTTRSLFKQYNEQYAGLNQSQKNLLREYINSTPDTSEFHKKLKKEYNEFKKFIVANKRDIPPATQVRLREMLKKTEDISKARVLRQRHIHTVLTCMQIQEEIAQGLKK
jgi:hypothetical protein